MERAIAAVAHFTRRYNEDSSTISQLRSSLLNIQGDNLCRLDSAPDTKIPPKEEFLESCARFHAQLSARNGVLEGCRTIAQLEFRIAELERKSPAKDSPLARFAELYCGHDPLSGKPAELAVMERIAELEREKEKFAAALKVSRDRIEGTLCHACMNRVGWDKEDRTYCPACNGLRIALATIDAALSLTPHE